MRAQRGFSIVEIMIALVVLLLLLNVLSQFFGRSVKTVGQITSNLIARRILDEQVSRILAVPGTFPLIRGPSGVAMTYVACFDLEGRRLANLAGVSDFTGVQIPEKNWGQLSGWCPQKPVLTHFEFHVHPKEASADNRVRTASIAFFTIKSGKKDQYIEVLLDYAAGY